MHALITGCAGFIGSRLARKLLDGGWDVLGVDSLSPYYARELKLRNLGRLFTSPRFRFHDMTVGTFVATHALAVDAVFHLAAQPGVRSSWGVGFGDYVESNIVETQVLLEALVCSSTRPRLIYSSSSSVYGNAPQYPTGEASPCRPVSPYGVTKLAGEQLCLAYSDVHGIDVVSLRYFTVYGPGQRPDMAVHRMLVAARDGSSFPLYGDGRQVRDFTYVDDVVTANELAVTVKLAGGVVMNICGGSAVDMISLIKRIEQTTGRSLSLERHPAQPGDPARTGGDHSAAVEVLGWRPATELDEGLTCQWEFLQDLKSE